VVQIIADRLNITRAEVHGVISFIMIFAKRPRAGISSRFAALRRARPSDRMCCHNARLKKNLAFIGVAPWRTGLSQSKRFFALACGPAAMIDNKVVGRVDAAKLDKLLAEAGA
jgi:formate dehydrogenase subunit gamma